MINNLTFSISWITNQLWQLSSVTLLRHIIKVSIDREDKYKVPSYSDSTYLTTEPHLISAMMHDAYKWLIHRRTEPMEIID